MNLVYGKEFVAALRLFKKRKEKNQGLSRDEALKCVPVKMDDIVEERNESGEMLLIYKTRVKPLLTGLVRRLGGDPDGTVEKKLQLDELGTFVWDLIGQGLTVRQVIDHFVDQYQALPQEAEVAVTSFLRELGRRGLIGLG